MADGSGRATTTEQFIVGAQKSTNHLKALLAKLLPATPGGHGDGGGSASVDAVLSDITDSLSQALASLRLGSSSGGQRPPAQSSIAGGGGRRSAPRSGQRIRTDAVCRMIVLQTAARDSYPWKKYGQKDIHGARFPRSYFKCGRKPSCPAKKQVQRSDADPAKLQITYIDAHTCHGPPPSLLAPDPAASSSGDQRNTAAAQLAPSADTVPAAPRHAGRASSSSHSHHVPEPDDDPMLCSTVPQVAAAGRAAAPPSARHEDLVPDEDDDEERDELLHIPSPACSQSDLLPAETASKVSPHDGSLVPMGQTLACRDDWDFSVPEMYHVAM